MDQEKLMEKLQKMPEIETKIGLSKDKKWVIIKTEITKIMSKNYFDVIFKGKEVTEEIQEE